MSEKKDENQTKTNQQKKKSSGEIFPVHFRFGSSVFSPSYNCICIHQKKKKKTKIEKQKKKKTKRKKNKNKKRKEKKTTKIFSRFAVTFLR